MRILVQDEEKAQREIMLIIASQAGIECTCTETAEQTLEFLQAHPVDVLVCRWHQYLEVLRGKIPAGVRVVAKGASTRPDNVQATLSAGAAGFLLVPFTKEEFLACLRES